MTREELLAPFKDVHLQYKYEPVKDCSMRPVLYNDNVRSLLKEESCNSNVIGKDDETILELLCYDAG